LGARHESTNWKEHGVSVIEHGTFHVAAGLGHEARGHDEVQSVTVNGRTVEVGPLDTVSAAGEVLAGGKIAARAEEMLRARGKTEWTAAEYAVALRDAEAELVGRG
jgi:hypothetical protein